MLYGDGSLATGENVPNVDGIYCFPWPDTGQIASVKWTNCQADGKLSVAMSLEKFNEFIAVAQGAQAPQPGETAGFTASEIQALKYQAANPSPFNLSISDGSLIAGSVAAVWAFAWVLRQVVAALGSDREHET